ncbi:hypothetical protein LUZ60_003467 [Juncus effusus]|nr:hypothetical protein LUZ60_003467 [Juncus effusus]
MVEIITEEMKAKAEIYHGDEICREKSKFLLQQVGLPNGLLPLRDVVECGFVEETGFVWLKQKKKIQHYFHKAKREVSYGQEITAYVEKYKIKRLTGVKTKELMLWISLSDISVEDPTSGLIRCKTPTGIVRSLPASAFELAQEEEN